MPVSPLDKQTANLLTTTQIITSVYSVVKELVENALDAGATNIEINLIDHGLTLIEVKDDGTGITKEDIPYVALPSYTSKISSFKDLEALHSYGFRGEALNALCNVSDVIIITKTNQDDVGSIYSLSSTGNIGKTEICHRSVGTTIQVKLLFKNIPIRRRIISDSKKVKEDVKLVERLLQAYGICRPSIRITLRVNNQIVLSKPSFHSMEEAFKHGFGRKLVSNIEWTEITTDGITVKMALPSKEIQGVSDFWQIGCQYIFANNRPIQHKELEKIIHKTFLEHFGQNFPSKRKAIFLVDISINPADIDVNLEPNKTVVLFKNQSAVFSVIEKHIRIYYGLDEITDVEDELNSTSVTETLSYSTDVDGCNLDEMEWPACKKRRLDIEKTVTPIIKERKCEKQSVDQTIAKSHNEDIGVLIDSLPVPVLSDSDSNDATDFIAVNDQNNSIDIKQAATSGCKDMENVSRNEEFSQLPVVDLGEDFNIEDVLNNLNETNTVNCAAEKVVKLEETVTLSAWSKGHVPGLKEKTDVRTFAGVDTSTNSKDNLNSTLRLKDTGSTAFAIFSKNIRSQVKRENPTLTISQIAQKISDLWKMLSPEERGYYRDLAREQKDIHKTNKSIDGKGRIGEQDVEMNRKRFLNMIEGMKKIDKKQNMVMRTITLWHTNQSKITEAFRERFTAQMESLIVVGHLATDANIWIVHNNSQLWLLNLKRIKDEFKSVNINTSVVNSNDIQRLLREWYIVNEDATIMTPFFMLPQNGNEPCR